MERILRELQARYRQIEAGEAEMARYRRCLADRLAEPRFRWRPVPAAAAALTAVVLVTVAVVAVLLRPSVPEDRLSGLQLADLQVLAADPPPQLTKKARDLIHQEQSPERWNALLLLCLTEERTRAVRLAAQGLQSDPRAEFRYLYLEILLDKADEYRYNEQRIVQLMDRESDKDCLRLYRCLLHLAT